MVSRSTRDLVYERAGQRCEYCGMTDSGVSPLEIDHIQAIQHYGSDEPDNLALACGQCNMFKGPNLASVDRQTRQKVFLFHPRDDNWSEHFNIEDDGRIVGKTIMGRATADLLRVNDFGYQKTRRRLVRLGLWMPPGQA